MSTDPRRPGFILVLEESTPPMQAYLMELHFLLQFIVETPVNQLAIILGTLIPGEIHEALRTHAKQENNGALHGHTIATYLLAMHGFAHKTRPDARCMIERMLTARAILNNQIGEDQCLSDDEVQSMIAAMAAKYEANRNRAKKPSNPGTH